MAEEYNRNATELSFPADHWKVLESICTSEGILRIVQTNGGVFIEQLDPKGNRIRFTTDVEDLVKWWR